MKKKLLAMAIAMVMAVSIALSATVPVFAGPTKPPAYPPVPTSIVICVCPDTCICTYDN